jgi:hypothetical protein
VEDNDSYEEQFKSSRDNTFTSAIKVLFALNKRGYLNGFDLNYLSMPIEYSIQHNYWAFKMIRMHLTAQNKIKTYSEIASTAKIAEQGAEARADHQNHPSIDRNKYSKGEPLPPKAVHQDTILTEAEIQIRR